jgi:hypothetical protein
MQPSGGVFPRVLAIIGALFAAVYGRRKNCVPICQPEGNFS